MIPPLRDPRARAARQGAEAGEEAARASTQREGPGRAQRSEHGRSHPDAPHRGSSPAGTTNTAYAYDFDRALGDVTRPDAIIVHHGYDTAGRLQTVTLPTGTITRTYNPTTGRLATIAGPAGETLTFGYDGFLQTSTTFSGPVAGTVSVTYDNDFRVATKTVNATPAVSFGYDTDSVLTTAGAMTLTPQFPTGFPGDSTLGVVQDSFGYDSFGDLASYAASASSTALFSENITLRDAIGRIKTKTETVQGVTHAYEYTYDTRGRLTDVKVDGVQSAHYAFDGPKGANRNRSSRTAGGTTTSATYDNQDRLLTYGTASYAYGANGELRTKTVGAQVTTYTYDALGSLLTVALPGGPTIDYVVDGLGRRVGKKVNGTLVKGFLYENQLRVIAELDGSNNVVSTFVYGTKINVPEYMIRAGVTYRLITDQLGSVRLVVNTASGAVAHRIDYDEFGVVTSDSSPGFQPFGFAGGLYDPDTKLVRFGARDYAAELGRWTKKDALRFRGRSANLYAYDSGDPINTIDPHGTLWWVIGGAAAGAGLDLASQLAGGCGIDDVDWGEVGLAGLSGALLGAGIQFIAGGAAGATDSLVIGHSENISADLLGSGRIFRSGLEGDALTAANQAWLDEGIGAGKSFDLATPFAKADEMRAYWGEIRYLLSHGYVPNPGGTVLIPP